MTILFSPALFPLCLQSFPASESFPISGLIPSGGQSIEASALALVLLMNTQCWFPLGLTGLISCGPRDFQESSSVQFESISSLTLSLLYCPALTSVHDYWKSRSFDGTDLCRPSDVFAFQQAIQICNSFSSKQQAPSNFMGEVTIHSDFGAQENKVCHSVSQFNLVASLFLTLQPHGLQHARPP